MAKGIFHQIATLIESERDALLAEWRHKVRELPSARDLDTPTLNDHIPDLLAEIVEAFRSGSDETIAEAVIEGSPPAHGLQRVKDGYDIEELVAEYNILRGCIHDLAEQNNLDMRGKPFHVLNRVLDGAIGAAVQTFSNEKALEVRHRREEYLAFVAHDLRTPLGAVSLTARILEMLLARDPIDKPQATRMLNTLHRSVQNLEGLVGKVIEENSNLETEVGLKLILREFELWPLVESLIHDLQTVARSGSTHLMNNVPEDFVVYADASLLRRIFQNLIANAINYTPQGDVVIGAIKKEQGGGVECFVRDNGTGISPERSRTMFEKHITNPDRQGGLGLGLAIVKMFVEAHNGVVTVESKLSAGTTIRFTLPER